MGLSQGKIKVLVVDDSAAIRALLQEIIATDARLEVVACAKDPYEARDLIKRTNPDVLTLDIEMPRMNGIVFLKNLMRLRPMPVVMISTLTQEGAPATLEALESGAVDFLGKPRDQGDAALEQYRQLITEKIYWAAQARTSAAVASKPSAPLLRPTADKVLRKGFICAIGASTGGTEAIKQVLQALPDKSPPLVVTQHIPAAFSTSFAKRLDTHCRIRVYEAEHNQTVQPGCAYLAPGHSHLRIARSGESYVCKLDHGEPVNRHRPAVEVLFDSVGESAGPQAMGVLLTGMGADGAQALLRLRERGCNTVAQNEETSVVWGMPGMAVKLGAAQKVLALDRIARYILSEAFR